MAVKVWYPIFQSTLPREERHICSQRMDKEVGISIHAPTRGATASVSDKLIMTQFQSTLPREERPTVYLTDCETGISIHAPTRGATSAGAATGSLAKFQSTLPREERPLLLGRSSKANNISIHAPTRGATISRWKRCVRWSRFQSTLPREERRSQPH